MYNLVEYSDDHMKTSGSFWQYYRVHSVIEYTIDRVHSDSFKFKINITGKTQTAGNTKEIKIAVPLKYLSNFGELLKCL